MENKARPQISRDHYRKLQLLAATAGLRPGVYLGRIIDALPAPAGLESLQADAEKFLARLSSDQHPKEIPWTTPRKTKHGGRRRR